MAFTKEQISAIETSAKDIIVTASAGSGKTTILVERILRNIKSGTLDLDRLLAITFTNDAASNLKAKIYDALLKNSDKNLEENLAKVPNAHIMTIDALCLDIAKKYYYKVPGLDEEILNNKPDKIQEEKIKQEIYEELAEQYGSVVEVYGYRLFDIIDDINNKIYTNAYNVEETFNKLKNSADNQYSEEYVDNKSAEIEEQLDAIIKTIEENKDYEKIVNQLHSIEKIFDKISEYRENSNPETLKELISEISSAKMNKTTVKDVESAGKITELNNGLKKKSNADKYSEFIEELEEIFNLIKTKREEQLQEENSKKDKIKSIVEFINKISQEKNQEKIQHLVKKIKENIALISKAKERTTLRGVVIEVLAAINYELHGKKVFLDLVEMSYEFYNEYSNRKKENKLADYNDILRYAIEILEDKDIEAEYKEKYQEIYVDEFQDTNRIQDALINKLRGEDTTLFIVGDIKQSIYRFRNADPSIMREYVKNAENNDEMSEENLPHNFRSNNAVINFNNAVYEKMMNFNKNKDSYDKNFMDRDIAIKGENPYKEIPEEDVDVSVIYEEKIAPSQDEIMIEDELLNKTAREAVNYIVRDKNYNNYQNKDIAVLVATNAEVTEFKKEFERLNVPVYASSESSFYENQAVHTIMNFLRTIENNSDTESWLYVLQSSMFELTYKEIAEIVTKNQYRKLHFAESLENSRVKEVVNKITKQFVERYNEEVSFLDLVYRLKYRPVTEIINFLYSINNFYSERVSKAERGGLDRLIELASEREYSLATFINYMSNLDKIDIDDASPFSKNDDVIKIMTVHKSKGLEFKKLYVYIKDSASKESGTFIYNNDNGLALINIPTKEPLFEPIGVVYETEAYKDNQEKNKVLEFEETTRTLYVATTRAEEKLSLLLNYKKSITVPEESDDEISVSDLLCEDVGKLDTAEIVVKARKGKDYILKSLYDENAGEFTRPINLIKKTQANLVKEEYDSEIERITESDFKLSNINLRSNFAVSKTEDTEAGTLHRKAADRGTRIHKAIEKYHLYADELDSFVDKKDADRIRNLYANEDFKNYLAHTHEFETMYYTSEEDTEREVRNNIIDFWAELDDKVVIVDFKTNYYTEEADYIKTYKDQLDRYRDYIQKQYPSKKVETYIYSLELEKMIEIK